MNLSNVSRLGLMAVLALGLVALAGCAVKGGSGDANTSRSADNSGDGTVTTAMVAYADGDDILFVDQDTQAPYIPTNIDEATITFEGETIEADDLQAGNIVTVTGNGVMLESYPGQYPGIAAVEVTSVGSPADAEQYAALVDQVFAAPDQAEVPTGNLDYKTSDAQVSIALNAYEFEWEYQTADGQTTTNAQDGTAFNLDGTLNENAIDARISTATDAFAALSVSPTSVEIERRPLAQGDGVKVDPSGEGENVPCTMSADGAVAFTIEPNYLYELQATFPQGEAEYAFYTVS